MGGEVPRPRPDPCQVVYTQDNVIDIFAEGLKGGEGRGGSKGFVGPNTVSEFGVRATNSFSQGFLRCLEGRTVISTCFKGNLQGLHDGGGGGVENGI